MRRERCEQHERETKEQTTTAHELFRAINFKCRERSDMNAWPNEKKPKKKQMNGSKKLNLACVYGEKAKKGRDNQNRITERPDTYLTDKGGAIDRTDHRGDAVDYNNTWL